MKILITAFEPFGGCDINPSEEVLKLLTEYISNTQILKQSLPVSFNKAFSVMEHRLKEEQFDFIIMLGQYGGAERIRLEMAGHNIISTKHPDNDGNIPMARQIIEGAEYGYFTDIDLWELSQKLKHNGITVDISESAGTYVCNFVYFSCLHYILENKLNSKALFIHLPYIKEQGKEPYMSLDEECNAVSTILSNLIEQNK